MPAVRSALALVVWGLLLDLVDVRVAQFDVLPDVVGLGLVVLGLKDLSERLPGLAHARRAGTAAAVLSLADLVHPLRTTSEVSGPMTTTITAAAPPTGLWGVASGLHEVVVALVLVLLCRAVERVAREGGWAVVAEVFGRLVLWNAALLVVVVLATAAGAALGEEASELGAVLLPVVVVGVVLRVWTLARLWGLREGPPLVPPEGSAGSTHAGGVGATGEDRSARR